jgi:hypothetical protein
MGPRIALAAAVAFALSAGTAAAAEPRVTLRPSAGAAGTHVVVRGDHWAQIEFCKPRVILAVDDVVFARALLDGHGRFAVRWRIPAAGSIACSRRSAARAARTARRSP